MTIEKFNFSQYKCISDNEYNEGLTSVQVFVSKDAEMDAWPALAPDCELFLGSTSEEKLEQNMMATAFFPTGVQGVKDLLEKVEDSLEPDKNHFDICYEKWGTSIGKGVKKLSEEDLQAACDGCGGLWASGAERVAGRDLSDRLGCDRLLRVALVALNR